MKNQPRLSIKLLQQQPPPLSLLILNRHPPLPSRRSRRQRQPSPEAVDPTGRVQVPDDPNLASCPDPVGEQALAEAFPHLPDNLSRDPNDVDQPLVAARPTEGRRAEDAPPQGGARKERVLSFSNPKRGNFSYRRRRPDVSALRQILSEL